MRRIHLLEPGGAEVFHEAAVRVLGTTGIALESGRVEALLTGRGARKDDDGRILLPRELVEWALERVPRGFTLFDRDGAPALAVQDGQTWFGPGSDALYQADRPSGEPRDSLVEDIGANVQLADALGYDFVMSMALPRGLDGEQLYPRVFVEIVTHTARPVVVTAISVQDVRRVHEIASIVAGGRERLRERPFLLAYLEPVSPLRFDRACVEKLEYCATNQIPFVFASGANCGIGAPITTEGGVVQGTAESLAGLVIAMLLDEQPRFVFGANTSSADMRTGSVCYGAPEWGRTVAMYAELGHHYRLPSWGTAGCTDSRRLDAQAAWEAARGVLLALEAGATLVHDMGYMAFGELFDARMLALAAELRDEARHMIRPADLGEEAMALDVIDEVARGGSLYLGHPHTRRRFRESLWMSQVPNRTRIGQPDESIRDRLDRRVDRALSRYEPTRPDPALVAEIETYLQSGS